MTKVFCLAVGAILTGCASSPQSDTYVSSTGVEGQPSLTPAAYTNSQPLIQESTSLEVCDTQIVRKRAELSSDCINIIDKAPTAGKRYHAVGLDVKEDPQSLCRNMYTPRCRKDF